MDTGRLTEKLKCFGLTGQEASVYLCLVRHGAQTGYEAARQTGISRSNAYSALAGLVDKGAAYAQEGAAVRYYAVCVDEFCSNKIRELEEIKAQLASSMPAHRQEAEGYLTITGDHRIRDKIKNMICSARARVYVSMTEAFVRLFEREMQQAAQDGKSRADNGRAGCLCMRRSVPDERQRSADWPDCGFFLCADGRIWQGRRKRLPVLRPEEFRAGMQGFHAQ